MFEKSIDDLKALGADITTYEIKQQPELWRDTFNIYKENKEAINAFLADARAMGEGRLSVVFTGAGTSDYVGEVVVLNPDLSLVETYLGGESVYTEK